MKFDSRNEGSKVVHLMTVWKKQSYSPPQSLRLGFVRDEETLEASMYLNKLPEKFAPVGGQRVQA